MIILAETSKEWKTAKIIWTTEEDYITIKNLFNKGKDFV